MVTTKKQLIENAVSLLKDIENIDGIRFHVYFKDGKEYEESRPVKTTPSYPTKKEKIYKLCRQFLFNSTNREVKIDGPNPKNRGYNWDISNIDRFEVHECQDFHIISAAERKYIAKHGRR